MMKVVMKQNPKPQMKNFSNLPSEEDPGLAHPHSLYLSEVSKILCSPLGCRA